MKIFLSFFIVYISIAGNVFASASLTLKTKSFVGEKLFANVMIDISSIELTGLSLGNKMDYQLMNLRRPESLNDIYVELTNIEKGGNRIAYIKSNEVIKQEDFEIILKLFSDKKPKIFSFKVHLTKRIKKDNEFLVVKKKIKYLFTPFYRTVSRDIKISENKANSKVRLLLARFQVETFDNISVFSDVGYGVFQIEDSVSFSSLTVPVNVDKFDGGRSIAYGGGINADLYNVKKLKFNLLFNYTRFESESKSNSLKYLNSSATASWSEYYSALGLTYDLNKFFIPKVAVAYSKIDGSFSMNQNLALSLVENEKKNIDEENPVGVVVGFNSRPIKNLTIVLSSELVNQTSFKFGLTFDFN